MGEVGLNLKTVLKKKNQVVAQLTSGVNILVKRRGIESLTEYATLQSDRSILVQTETVETRIQTTNTILATGSAVVELPFFPMIPKPSSPATKPSPSTQSLRN